MMDQLLQQLAEYTQLTPSQLAFCTAAVFTAGLVRGFSGFALSALLMASIVVIIAPVELIPVCFVLEGVAGIVMIRGGFKNADMSIVWGLVIGSTIGLPIGLLVTISFSEEASKLIALMVILALTIAQLFRVSPKFIGTTSGLYISGLIAGIVTGLASVGGMVVALYVLASKAEVKKMRASLVMFLFIGMFTSLIFLLLYDVMNPLAVARGVVLAPVVLVGVVLGSWLFRPSLEAFYKRFCLILLILLSVSGLFRLF